MKEKRREAGKSAVVMYGVGNFSAQLSWTMVSTYLSVFYTDVFGLTPMAVSILMLVAKVWDGINDPMMGAIMQKNHSRWGKYRPFIFVGSLILMVFTVLTFSVPGFGSTGKLVWAYVTYIGLGMSYTMENVPFNALPSRMTKDPNRINQIFSSGMMGGAAGGILLMSCTLPIVTLLGQGSQKAGYQRTAALYAAVSVVLNIIVLHFCQENVEDAPDASKSEISTRETFAAIFRNKNLMLLFLYTLIMMTAVMGRVGVMVYFYMYCVNAPALMGILMIIPNIAGLAVMPLAPAVMKKYGKKAVAILGCVLGAVGLAMMFFGPYTNIPWMVAASVIYGLYSIGAPCGGGLLIDAVDDYEAREGIRTEGLAFSVSGLMNKIGGGIGSAAGIALIGAFGYRNGTEITESIKTGINLGANCMPFLIMLAAIVPLLFYNLDEKKMAEVRQKLQQKQIGE